MDSCTGRRDSIDNVDSMEMSYELLKTITGGFSKDRLLGCGTFGMVYKGVYINGEEVAVKVLRDMAALDDKKFMNEFQNLVRFDHENIVHLLGYCNESEQVVVECDGKQVPAEMLHVALCFEYVNNGSLSDHISDEKHGLQWHIRYKIIKGICEGLKYLHTGLEKPVLHLDLKPDNILLDNQMVPKIADFGLSRLIGDERTRQTMNQSIGTLGYLAPEFIKFQLLSPAFDIFSLGVIITKIIMGTEHYHDIADMPTRKLIKHVHTNWKKRLHQEIVEPRSLVEVFCEQVKTCIEIASKCLMDDRRQRPTIEEIVATLNKTETIQRIPSNIQEIHDGHSARAFERRIRSDSTSGGEAIRSSHTENKSSHAIMMPRKLSYKLLQNITDGFSNTRKIGQGNLGAVYKGVFEDGQVIAVKVFNSLSGINDSMLPRQVEKLVQVQHDNIVKLVGYCEEEKKVIVEHNGRKILAVKTIRALCFEYYRNGSLGRYISDKYCGLDWCTCYKILKGSCDALRHLHEGLRHSPLLHLHLKPSNILLDENMAPKIGDFHLSRLLKSERLTLTLGTMSGCKMTEYQPPEFINKGVTSNMHDIFSLGVIILRTIVGSSGCYSLRHHLWTSKDQLVHGYCLQWKERLQETSKGRRSLDGYCRQVKRCIEIGLRCIEDDRHKRPTIGEIVGALDETETWIHDDDELLEVHPMELRFPFKPKKHASCLLQLHNSQDDHVVFRLVSKTPGKYLSKLPLYGIVPPGCTYTLSLTTCKQPQRLPSDSNNQCFLLQSVAINYRSYLDQSSVIRDCEGLFNKAQDVEETEEVTLKCLCVLPQAEEASASSSKISRPEIEIIAMLDAQQVSSIEVHPEKPWIMTTHHGGHLRIWDYHKMATVNPIEVPDQPVYVAKFITREEWIVAGEGNGCIHVFSYDESQDDMSFKAHDGQILSLAVHPTEPYVLSTSHGDYLIKLWHWDQHWDFEKDAWMCTRIFEGHSDKVSQVVFNLEDPCYFASASWDGTIKIWDLKTDMCNNNALDKHQDGLLCVDYMTSVDHQHLISGSKDGTVQIWDLETKRCREYLQGHACHISVVCCRPEIQKLITGSLDGTVRIWDSTKFRLENIIAFNLGAVSDVGYIDKLQRIVVGCQQGIAMMEIKFHEQSIIARERKKRKRE